MIEERTAKLFAAALFVRATEDRLARLRELAEGTPFADALHGLESHGVLSLVLRNLRSAAVPIPEPWASRLVAREDVLKRDGMAARLTLRRFLSEAREQRLDVILLKGAALADGVYPEPDLRNQGDVDVLVRAIDVAHAMDVAGRAGCVPNDHQLPDWWYRWTHFHAKAHPAVPLLKEIEIHWHLHGPSLLTTVETADLWARRIPAKQGGDGVFVLDPLDGILHLITHLSSHWLGRVPRDFSSTMVRLLSTRNPTVRFKWFVDVIAFAEAHAQTLSPFALGRRAREWNVEATLRDVLVLLEVSPLPTLETRGWMRDVLRELPPTRGIAAVSPLASEAPLPGLDFRWAAARAGFWRWSLPPATFLVRRHGTRCPVLALRVLHALGVSAFVARAVLALPFALIGRIQLRARRQAARRRWSEPECVLDLVLGSRTLNDRSGVRPS